MLRLIIILFISLNLSFVSFSQVVSFSQESEEFHFNFGLNYPTIGFVDSKGNQTLLSDFNNVSSNHLKLGYKQVVSDDLGFIVSLISNRYDLFARYELSPSVFNYVKYDLDYVSASLAITLDVKLNDDLNLVPNIGLNYNYLISGFQVLYGEVFNLKESEDFVPFSYSITPGFYLSKSLTPYMSFHLGYNFVFDFMTEEEVSDLQSYNLESHTFFVGAAFNLGSLIKHSRTQELVEKKLLKLERSYSTIVNSSEDYKLHVDSIFISGTNLNSILQSEIENHIASLDISQDSSDPDFVFLFPSKDSIYYSLFDDIMLDLLSTANSQDDLNIKIVGYADLKGNDQNNLFLSKKRTETIRNSLIDSGVSPNRIRVEFLGETSMFDSNVFMPNRRVEIFINTN